ncbi:MAG: site-specific integrase, partial [Candidatus Methylomirabilis sp.]|nr:site-specific integrase [Deltaproteobacteria bacterium]
MPKLTKRFVEALKPPEKGDYTVWDTELKAFGVRVTAAGARSYFVNYRTPGGKMRRHTIGKHGELTVEKARELAGIALGSVRAGNDPAKERADARSAPTVADLCARFLSEHAAERKKPTSRAHDEICVRLYVAPALGSLKVGEVERAHVEKLHRSLKDRPYMANRVLALLSTMFNLAEKWELRPAGTNPTRHVERWKEKARERFLSQEELARLGDALADSAREGRECPQAVLALRLLALTGARRGEILGLRWEHVDFERRMLRLPDSKTGAKVIPLNAPALQILTEARETAGSEWVIPGDGDAGKPFVGLPKAWRRVAKRAGLDGARIHDLRHSFASYGAGANFGLPVIGKLMGHAQVRTTNRYAHLAAD